MQVVSLWRGGYYYNNDVWIILKTFLFLNLYLTVMHNFDVCIIFNFLFSIDELRLLVYLNSDVTLELWLLTHLVGFPRCQQNKKTYIEGNG